MVRVGKVGGTMGFFGMLRWLRTEGAVLWRALLDAETPLRAKLMALAVIVYVVSPLDIIPDFIPVVGWLDDLIVIPLGFALVRMLVPPHMWARAGGAEVQREPTLMKDVTPGKFGER